MRKGWIRIRCYHKAGCPGLSQEISLYPVSLAETWVSRGERTGMHIKHKVNS